MKLIVNAASTFKGGAEQVANSFINECKIYPENEYHILLCDNIYYQLDIENFGSNFYFYKLESRPVTGLITFFKSLSYFNRLENRIKPDVVISTGDHGYWNPKAWLVVGYNIPHHVYRDTPYFDSLPLRKKLYWSLRKKFDLFFYRRADALIVQTDDVNNRLSALIPDKPIFTVSNTVNSYYLNYKKRKINLPQKQVGEIRFLTMSANYKHKNLEIIKEVIPALTGMGVENFKFILTLPKTAFEDFKDGEVYPHIVNLGPVPIKDGPSLYEECDFMFLPSLLECFSASYAEAMAMEKPILTSNLPFAKTVCKDAAVYFDPMNPVEIASKIRNLIKNPVIQDELVQKGKAIFKHLNTPEERAKRFLEICEDQIN